MQTAVISRIIIPTPDSRLPTPDSRLPTPDSRLPTQMSRFDNLLLIYIEDAIKQWITG
ncbi:MAG: hypothetical protein F6J98_22630 [Moorea sp. SIO4G2]|nr:hypothetical protein [Moorena sp. SIO4G2]